MDREILERIMTAKAYQKKAIYELFPEEICGHLDVIAKEIEIMTTEFIESWIQERNAQKRERKDNRDYENSKNSDIDSIKVTRNDFNQRSGARKINIV